MVLLGGGPQGEGAHRVDERHELRVELGHEHDGPRRVEERGGLDLPRSGARPPRVGAGAAVAAAARVLQPALQRRVARAGEHGRQRLQGGYAARGEGERGGERRAVGVVGVDDDAQQAARRLRCMQLRLGRSGGGGRLELG